jgi:hypothetical protein
VRRFSWTLAMVLQLFPAAALAEPKVELGWRRMWVKDTTELRRQCGTEKEIAACGQLVRYELDAVCRSTQHNQWKIGASARLEMRLYFYNPVLRVDNRYVLQHELIHAIDIQDAVKFYLEDVEERLFSSQTSCEEAASLEMARFKSRVAAFAKHSQKERY